MTGLLALLAVLAIACSASTTPSSSDVSVRATIQPAMATPAAPMRIISVTRADDGRTVDVSVGDTVALELGDGTTVWDVEIGNDQIVAPVVGSVLPPGMQGLYTAR